MSKYTTGEVAKLCGVSVRTVQYYDSRGICVPESLSEGGRRLYSEENLRQMKMICFLRELDLSINDIKSFLSENYSEETFILLLDEQERRLRIEMSERQAKLDKMRDLRQSIKRVEQFSSESFGDITRMMEDRKKLRRMRLHMLAVGIVINAIEVSTLLIGILKGVWLPFIFGMCVVLGLGIWISCLYFKQVAYICPHCHIIFRPAFKKVFWAAHTPSTRRLTCPDCGFHGFCVEAYESEDNKGENI